MLQRKRLPFGDFKMSEVNSALRLSDTGIPKTIGAMCDMAIAFAPSWPSVELMPEIVDFAHALNRNGLGQESKPPAVITLAAPDGQVMMSYLNTQPFGPHRAPSNWDRVTQFVFV